MAILNGFTTSGSGGHKNSYTYTGTSGTSYYAEVTIFATIGGVTDSRTITTNTVKAPYNTASMPARASSLHSFTNTTGYATPLLLRRLQYGMAP